MNKILLYLCKMHCLLTIILIVAIVCILVNHSSNFVVARQKLTERKISSMFTKIEWIPKNWNWFEVSSEDANAWSFSMKKPLMPGKYASNPINQHETGYCGCCFLVAAIQCVQDAYNIKDAFYMKKGEENDKRIYHFDINKAMNDFTRIHRANVANLEQAGMHVNTKKSTEWNACMGGDPIDVLNSIADKKMSLKLRHGYKKWESCSLVNEEEPFRKGYSILNCNYLIFDEIDLLKREILKGPVILGIRALNLWDIKDGVIDNCNGSAGADRDHVVCVVGWRGNSHWICRNSWGDKYESEIWSRPEDVRECMVQCGQNKSRSCESDKIIWRNDFEIPGVFLVPMDKFENCAGIYDEPTGWLKVDI